MVKAEDEDKDILKHFNIKEWTRCSIPTMVHVAEDRKWQFTLKTYASFMSAPPPMPPVAGHDAIR